MSRWKLRFARAGFATLFCTSVVTSGLGLSAPILVHAAAGSPGTITTVAGSGSPGFCNDNQLATTACLSYPFNIAISSHGVLYIADGQNHRIRRVDNTTGLISTIAGTGTAGFCGDGGPATSACLNDPTSVAVDATGNVYVMDGLNFVVRKISTGGVISTVAGTPGVHGFCGDGGPAISACLNFAFGIAVDSHNNLFIADTVNSRVRAVSATDGKISTVAGNGTNSFCGDGGAAVSGCLNGPAAVTVGNSGQLFIADTNNQRVRQVSGGALSTVAGNGSASFCGDSGNALAACLNTPTGVAMDASNNLFISDSQNSRIREVSGGRITTFAGDGQARFFGDGGLAVNASLNLPFGVVSDSQNDVFIADRLNDRVREVFGVPSATGDGAGRGHQNGDHEDQDLGHFECDHHEANGCGRHDSDSDVAAKRDRESPTVHRFFPGEHGHGGEYRD